jgi:hypothetical protein
MSRRARTYREAYEAKHNPDTWDFAPTWQDDRDSDDDELPERDDDDQPSKNFH